MRMSVEFEVNLRVINTMTTRRLPKTPTSDRISCMMMYQSQENSHCHPPVSMETVSVDVSCKVIVVSSLTKSCTTSVLCDLWYDVTKSFCDGSIEVSTMSVDNGDVFCVASVVAKLPKVISDEDGRTLGPSASVMIHVVCPVVSVVYLAELAMIVMEITIVRNIVRPTLCLTNFVMFVAGFRLFLRGSENNYCTVTNLIDLTRNAAREQG